MSLKLILTEEQFNFLLNEELGIAKEVVKISKIIEKNVYKFLDEKKDSDSIVILDDLFLSMRKIYFNTFNEFTIAFENNSDVYLNGYSYENETIYLTFIYINEKPYIMDNIENTIQHEVAHYWQCKNKNNTLGSKHYNEIIKYVYSENEIIATIAQLLYSSKHFEIDAQINGAFNEIKNNVNIKTIEDLINLTELKFLREKLLDIKNKITSWDYNSYNVQQALYVLNTNKNIRQKNSKPFNKKTLTNIINKTIDYFNRKTIRMFTLYMSNKNYIKNKKIKNDILDKKIKSDFL